MIHLSPILRGNNGFTCSFRPSGLFENRVRSAISLTSHQIGLLYGLVHFFEGERVSDGSPKNYLRRREIAIRVKGIPQLQQVHEEYVVVEGAIRYNI